MNEPIKRYKRFCLKYLNPPYDPLIKFIKLIVWDRNSVLAKTVNWAKYSPTTPYYFYIFEISMKNWVSDLNIIQIERAEKKFADYVPYNLKSVHIYLFKFDKLPGSGSTILCTPHLLNFQVFVLIWLVHGCSKLGLFLEWPIRFWLIPLLFDLNCNILNN